MASRVFFQIPDLTRSSCRSWRTPNPHIRPWWGADHERSLLVYVDTGSQVVILDQDGSQRIGSPLSRQKCIPCCVVLHPVVKDFLVVAWLTTEENTSANEKLSDAAAKLQEQKKQKKSNEQQNIILSHYRVSELVLDDKNEQGLTGDDVWLSQNCGKVTVLEWDSNGDALFAGTANGIVKIFIRKGPVDAIIGLGKGRDLPLESPFSLSHVIWKSIPTVTDKKGREPKIPDLFMATNNGDIYAAQPRKKNGTMLAATVGENIKIIALFHDEKSNSLLTMNENVLFQKFAISLDLELKQTYQVKLSMVGLGSTLQVVDLGGGIVAGVNKEAMVRVWDIERDENYQLSITDPKHMAFNNDIFECLAFYKKEGIMCAGTSKGRVCFWKYVGIKDTNGVPSFQDWQVIPPVNIGYKINSLIWGNSKLYLGSQLLLCAIGTDQVNIIQETRLLSKFKNGCSVSQTTPQRCIVNIDKKLKKINLNFVLKGVDIVQDAVLLWSLTGNEAEVHEISASSGPLVEHGRWESPSSIMCLCEYAGYTSVACAVPGNLTGGSLNQGFTSGGKSQVKINIYNFQGTVKTVIPINHTGVTQPNVLTAHGHYLVLVTSNGGTLMWDLKRREPKLLLPSRKFPQCPPIISNVTSNSNGTKLCISAGSTNKDGSYNPSHVCYVYDVERDAVDTKDFTKGYAVMNSYWDQFDPRVLVLNIKRSVGALEINHEERNIGNHDTVHNTRNIEESWRKTSIFDLDKDSPAIKPFQIIIMFATADNGLLIQDRIYSESELIGVKVPDLVFAPQVSEGQGINMNAARVIFRRMRDFEGIGDGELDENTRTNILDFSYHLAVGNMDEACRSVMSIRSENIWENMARMCVKTGRLEVAEICISHMRSTVQVSRALRQARQQNLPKDCQIAAVAVQLGMVKEAEEIYRKGGHWKLLANLYQGQGRWSEAFEVCEGEQRIHLKALHFEYARHFEVRGNIEEAIVQYQKASAQIEIPRLLVESQAELRLMNFVQKSQEPSVVAWWAQYCESTGEFEQAVKYYTRANDFLSVVRVHCRQGDFDQASTIALTSGSEQQRCLGGCFHLARQLEAVGKYEESIRFFKLANRFKHAARIALQLGDDNALMTIALEATNDTRTAKSVRQDAGQHFESVGEYGKAVTLYAKSGDMGKAIALCFKAQLFDQLKVLSLQMADAADQNMDPALLKKCAELFLSHNQYSKAAEMFIAGKQYTEALALIREYNVTLTAQMAEKLTPPKSKEKVERQLRTKILMEVGTCLRKQKNYHLACKKFTQAGDRIRAIECLIKDRATKKVIYYATKTKRKEIYILAANYLQNLDWHKEPSVMKSIINFYTMARAYEQLAYFYDACAQIEIDEYRDYEKALAGLKEAIKNLLKAGVNDTNQDDKIELLEQRILLVERFVEARQKIKQDPDESIAMLTDLLDAPNIESSVRVGDVFALLIEFDVSNENLERAYELIEKMQQRNIPLGPYLDRVVVERVFNTMGIPLTEIDNLEEAIDMQMVKDEPVEEVLEEEF